MARRNSKQEHCEHVSSAVMLVHSLFLSLVCLFYSKLFCLFFLSVYKTTRKRLVFLKIKIKKRILLTILRYITYPVRSPPTTIILNPIFFFSPNHTQCFRQVLEEFTCRSITYADTMVLYLLLPGGGGGILSISCIYIYIFKYMEQKNTKK